MSMLYTTQILHALQTASLFACTAGRKCSYPSAGEKLSGKVPEDQFPVVCDLLAQLMQPDMQQRVSAEEGWNGVCLAGPSDMNMQHVEWCMQPVVLCC